MNRDLTNGNIFSSLLKLGIPIMGASFIQMAYNMIDMIWIGRVGTEAVSAVGTAGFYTWFAMAFILISKTGAEIGISQSIGMKDIKRAKQFISGTIIINIILGAIYALVLIIFRDFFIGFFGLSIGVKKMGVDFLVMISLGMNFYFINPVFTAIFNAYGDSKTPFIINSIGLIANIILDPLLIFGFGEIPPLYVNGAGIATSLSQLIVTVIFLYKIKKDMPLFKDFNLFKCFDKKVAKDIINLGMPVAVHNGCFTIFAMVLGRIIASWGDIPIGVQKVGSQIEAISWMSVGGLASALSAFVGQNFGAKKWDRIFKGYFISIMLALGIGTVATYLFCFLPRPIFSIFIPHDDKAISLGIDYLKILGISQIFMCIEITTGGIFNGIGKTMIPSIVSIVFTGLRIPMAIVLSKESLLGLNGVWWSITITSILKGVVLGIIFVVFMSKNREYKIEFKKLKDEK